MTIDPPPAASSSGSAALARGDERVRAHVDRHPEAVARRIGEAALEILRRSERDRVDEDVELPTEHVSDLGEDAGDRRVVADVELRDERARHRLGQVADVLLDALALERERELGAAGGQPLRDRPRDRPLVGDSEDECFLSLEHRGRL